MSLSIVSACFALLAVAAGGLVATAVAALPLRVLSSAATGGRYAGLAAGERFSPVGPTSGRRAPIAVTLLGTAG